MDPVRNILGNKKFKVGDTVRLSNEFIEVEGDDSLKFQYFGIVKINGNIITISHETGLKLNVNKKYLI